MLPSFANADLVNGHVLSAHIFGDPVARHASCIFGANVADLLGGQVGVIRGPALSA